MLDLSSIKIINRSMSYNTSMFYNTSTNKFRLRVDTHYGLIDSKLTAINTVDILITYKSSMATRKYNRTNTRVAKKHKEIIKELIEYFESTIILPAILNGEMKNKYVNWYTKNN